MRIKRFPSITLTPLTPNPGGYTTVCPPVKDVLIQEKAVVKGMDGLSILVQSVDNDMHKLTS